MSLARSSWAARRAVIFSSENSIFGNVFSGRRIVLTRQFDAEEWLRLVPAEGVTHSFLVPTMVKRVLDHPCERRERRCLADDVVLATEDLAEPLDDGGIVVDDQNARTLSVD